VPPKSEYSFAELQQWHRWVEHQSHGFQNHPIPVLIGQKRPRPANDLHAQF
ncbi:uncharacterized protein METZ01_LOCUS75260, partial [marine metagenome]